MAASDSELQLVVRAIDEASATLEKVRSEVSGMSSSVKGDLDKVGAASLENQVRIGGMTGEIARLAAVVGVGLLAKQFADFGIGSASALQMTSTNMKLLVGNTDAANKVMGDLYSFSRGTPFAFPEVAQAAKILLQYGDTAETVVGTVQMLGNVVAVTGANYTRLAEIYGEVNAAGKIQMNNVQDLVQNGVPIMQAMATVTGTSIAKISEAMQQGGVSAAVFDAAMQHIAPPGALNEMANTLPTRLSALQGALRSVAFAILGINIDPIKGFVVEAGGLFDQISSAVGQLAKRLRDPDIINAMRSIGAAIGSISSAVIPAFLNLITLIGTNLNVIIPVVYGFATAIAALKFGEAILGMEKFIVAVIAGEFAINPFIAVLSLLGAVLGISLGSQIMSTASNMDALKNKTTDASKATNDNKTASDNAAAGQQELSKQAKQTADQMAELSKSMLRANEDFKTSLSDIVASHDANINSLKSQIESEKQDFTKAQQQKTDAFKQGQADQLAAHEDAVQTTQRQIDQEVLKGRFANQATLADLRDRLDKENQSYAQQTAKNLASYQKDTDNAKEQSDDKLTKLQQQLDGETAFMQKHVSDLQGIRAADAQDEIDKLVQSHGRQMADYNTQKTKIIQNSQDTINGSIAVQNAAMQDQINKNTFGNFGAQMGNQMMDSIKSALKNRVNDTLSGLVDLLTEAKQLIEIYVHYLPSLINPLTNNAANDKMAATFSSYFNTGVIKYRASGGSVDQAAPYIVGEEGPELFVPAQAGTIVPNGQVRGSSASTPNGSPSAGPVFNNVYNIYSSVDLDHAMQMQAWDLRNA